MNLIEYIGSTFGKEAYSFYGQEFVLQHLAEECAELFAEACHLSRFDREDNGEFLEECCDVVILVDECFSCLYNIFWLEKANTSNKKSISKPVLKTLKINLSFLMLELSRRESEISILYVSHLLVQVLKNISKLVQGKQFNEMYKTKMEKARSKLEESRNVVEKSVL